MPENDIERDLQALWQNQAGVMKGYTDKAAQIIAKDPSDPDGSAAAAADEAANLSRRLRETTLQAIKAGHIRPAHPIGNMGPQVPMNAPPPPVVPSPSPVPSPAAPEVLPEAPLAVAPPQMSPLAVAPPGGPVWPPGYTPPVVININTGDKNAAPEVTTEGAPEPQEQDTADQDLQTMLAAKKKLVDSGKIPEVNRFGSSEKDEAGTGVSADWVPPSPEEMKKLRAQFDAITAEAQAPKTKVVPVPVPVPAAPPSESLWDRTKSALADLGDRMNSSGRMSVLPPPATNTVDAAKDLRDAMLTGLNERNTFWKGKADQDLFNQIEELDQKDPDYAAKLLAVANQPTFARLFEDPDISGMKRQLEKLTMASDQKKAAAEAAAEAAAAEAKARLPKPESQFDAVRRRIQERKDAEAGGRQDVYPPGYVPPTGPTGPLPAADLMDASKLVSPETPGSELPARTPAKTPVVTKAFGNWLTSNPKYQDADGNFDVSLMIADISRKTNIDLDAAAAKWEAVHAARPRAGILDVIAAFFAGLSGNPMAMKIANQWHEDAMHWDDMREKFLESMGKRNEQNVILATNFAHQVIAAEQAAAEHRMTREHAETLADQRMKFDMGEHALNRAASKEKLDQEMLDKASERDRKIEEARANREARAMAQDKAIRASNEWKKLSLAEQKRYHAAREAYMNEKLDQSAFNVVLRGLGLGASLIP